jgi:trehalose-6-phosphatase
VIYNIQCKNNLIDYSQIERNPELVARHTRRMDRYYKKALEKEMARENLLKTHLGLQEVRHVVVCRFPIATENPRILAFAGIDEFKQRYAS